MDLDYSARARAEDVNLLFVDAKWPLFPDMLLRSQNAIGRRSGGRRRSSDWRLP